MLKAGQGRASVNLTLTETTVEPTWRTLQIRFRATVAQPDFVHCVPLPLDGSVVAQVATRRQQPVAVRVARAAPVTIISICL